MDTNKTERSHVIWKDAVQLIHKNINKKQNIWTYVEICYDEICYDDVRWNRITQTRQWCLDYVYKTMLPRVCVPQRLCF